MNHRNSSLQPVAADQIDDALKALDKARQLRRIWLDLQAPADAARREYEAAVGVVRALTTDVAEQVAA